MLRNNTKIVTDVIKDGKLHKIVWQNNRHSVQIFDLNGKQLSNPTYVTNIRELYPVQIFSQKELYSLTQNPTKLIELIDSQFDKELWNEEKEKLVSEWLSMQAKVRRLKQSTKEEENIRAKLLTVKNQIELYEGSVYKDTLDKFNKFNNIKNDFNKMKIDIGIFANELERIKLLIPEIQLSEEMLAYLDNETIQFINTIKDAVIQSSQYIDKSLDLVEIYKDSMEHKLESLPWSIEYKQSKKSYREIIESIEGYGSVTYEELINERKALEDKLNKVEKDKKDSKTLKQNLSELYEDIINKERELRSSRQAVLEKWSDDQSGTLKIELDPMSDIDNAHSSFRKLLRREGDEYSNYILTTSEDGELLGGIIADILKEPIESRWDKREKEIKQFLSHTENEPGEMDKRLARHIDNLKNNTPEDIDRLLIWVPEDKITLKLHKQGKIVNIDTGSAGERTAAMLGLLLALNDIPLIIDQPEDDLDTGLISNFVVENFKTLKNTRQIIVVTHNPNITVNANSDNIVYMKYKAGQIVVSANDALQNSDIRTAVCEVMEGGKSALDKRYYRISKALN